ncbi:hypothetical protein GW17_00005211 [Ensete ventricosum]|nr:hypothetical protein GW17_00005211 [Ensete ventricosum]
MPMHIGISTRKKKREKRKGRWRNRGGRRKEEEEAMKEEEEERRGGEDAAIAYLGSSSSGEVAVGAVALYARRGLEFGDYAKAVVKTRLKVAGTRTTHYWVVPPKIDRRQSILAVSGRLREKSTVGGRWSIEVEIGSIEGEKGKKKKKRKRRKRRGEEENLVPSSPTRRHPASALTRFFSRARRRNVSPRGEKRSSCQLQKLREMDPIDVETIKLLSTHDSDLVEPKPASVDNLLIAN